ncbi:MAG: hypothetical protein KAJ75_06880 [Alphaproteobacteria bacterium]|nr:hypothetical protein [Alphaproteobacteria bacterium]
MTKTTFQKELEQYFPELAGLLRIANTDPKVLVVAKALIEMKTKQHYGKLEITYQDGKINHVLQTISKK